MLTHGEVHRAYDLISAGPANSPDIRKLKAHLLRLLRSDRTTSLPTSPSLLPNYPNPFNPDTWIPYHLAQAGDVAISIYSASGQLVRTLNLGHREAGFYTNKGKSAHWDGRNDNSEQLASGLYFYVMRAGHFTAARKMLLYQFHYFTVHYRSSENPPNPLFKGGTRQAHMLSPL